MNVFYYWKNIAQDLKAGRIGYFKSSRTRFNELADGHPDFIWVFKTPTGLKGQVQLMGRLRWADKAVLPVAL